MRYFNLSEFDCKCGCGLNNMNLKTLLMLDVARTIAKVPFIVNSATRCETHNKKVGGIETSSHLKGLAVDIKCLDSLTRFKIVSGLIQAGFKRILIYKSFIHVDTDSDKISPIITIMR